MPQCEMCEYGKDDVNDIDDVLLIQCKKCMDEDEEAQWYYENQEPAMDLTETAMKAMSKEHEKYDQAHGSFYDRGGADCYYARARMPHKWESSQTMIVVLAKMPDEIDAYLEGYKFMEWYGARKHSFERDTERASSLYLYGMIDRNRYDYSDFDMNLIRFNDDSVYI